ncbi:hypothetical protein M885DRAFT_512470 [Pelagophyceae sp. CCMP2097]|nr:hypothetical protein M885DRAFT_512470 [Pelagophyceae sp. CCMP2097]
MSAGTPTKRPRTRKVLEGEFPHETKDSLSQVLSEVLGDIDKARLVLRRKSLAAKDEGEETDDYASEGERTRGVASESDDDPPPPRPAPRRPTPSGRLSDAELQRRKEARSKATDLRREARKDELESEKRSMERNRRRIMEENERGGRAISLLEPFRRSSSHPYDVQIGDERVLIRGARVLYKRDMPTGEWKGKVANTKLWALVANESADHAGDVLQYWTSKETDESKLLTEGAVVDLACTVTDNKRWEGIYITTIRSIKVHVVDGVQVRKAPATRRPRREADEDARPKRPRAAGPDVKPRVPGGKRRFDDGDRKLIRAAPAHQDDDPMVAHNAALHDLAVERAQRRQAGKKR